MFFYTTGDYESNYGETLEKFAKRIAANHVDNEYGEPNVEYLSVMFESEITLPKKALRQFQERVESYYRDEAENAAYERAYHNETRQYSNGQNRY